MRRANWYLQVVPIWLVPVLLGVFGLAGGESEQSPNEQGPPDIEPIN